MLRRKPDRKVVHLRHAACLHDWTDRELGVLAHVGDIGHFRAGDTITTRGERSKHAYILLSGVVAGHTSNGSSALVETALINGRAVLNREEASQTLFAETDLEVVALTTKCLVLLHRDCPSLQNLLIAEPAVTRRAPTPRSHAIPALASEHAPTALA